MVSGPRLRLCRRLIRLMALIAAAKAIRYRLRLIATTLLRPQASGMLNYAPPEGGDVTAQAPVTPPRAGTEGKVAQNDMGELKQLQDLSLDYAGRKHAQEKDIDAFQKNLIY
jgi:hypothetical protein